MVKCTLEHEKKACKVAMFEKRVVESCDTIIGPVATIDDLRKQKSLSQHLLWFLNFTNSPKIIFSSKIYEKLLSDILELVCRTCGIKLL